MGPIHKCDLLEMRNIQALFINATYSRFLLPRERENDYKEK